MGYENRLNENGLPSMDGGREALPFQAIVKRPGARPQPLRLRIAHVVSTGGHNRARFLLLEPAPVGLRRKLRGHAVSIEVRDGFTDRGDSARSDPAFGRPDWKLSLIQYVR